MEISTVDTVCRITASWLNEPNPQDPNWSTTAWQTFQLACRVHGIGPLLYQKLSGAEWLDPPVRHWLVEQYTFNGQRIAKMCSELQVILALFAQHDIPLMPLKGSILAVRHYQDPGWRPMADLDLLIQAQDFEASAQLLAQLGYEREVAHWKHTEFSKPDNRRVASTTYEHPDNPRKLELHVRCRETFGGPTLDLTELMWANSTRGELLGEQTNLPQLEALWLHVLVHATYHVWQGKGRLIHLIDLTRISPHLTDPQGWLNRVNPRFTYPALVLQKKYFPDTVAEALLDGQQGRLSPDFRQWVESLDLVNTSYLNPKPAGLYLTKALKFSEGRPAEVFQAFRFALLPSLAEIALDHPRLARSKAPWLGYFLLPLDWVKRIIAHRE